MGHFEDEYFLLYPADVKIYPMIYEDCHRLKCSYDQYHDCDKVPDCPAYSKKKIKIENPHPFVMDFFTLITKKPVVFYDIYLTLSLSKGGFAVSPKLHSVLASLNIEGLQFIPVTLMEDNKVKYSDFWYVNVYNYLPVLSARNSVFEKVNGRKISNNILQIKFDDKKMSKIPLEKRLIFKLPMERNYFLIHKSVECLIPFSIPVKDTDVAFSGV
jgi:hypothetical protein